jgi:hypothetical protein
LSRHSIQGDIPKKNFLSLVLNEANFKKEKRKGNYFSDFFFLQHKKCVKIITRLRAQWALK